MELQLSKNVELLSIYGNSKFCTVIDKDILYLLKSTIISNDNIIASISIENTIKIFNRDLANIFVDWSNLYSNKHKEIDKLSEQQIKDYIYLYLKADALKLIKFDNFEFSGKFKEIFDRYPATMQSKIIAGLEKLGVYKNDKFIIPWYQALTIDHIQESIDNSRPFIKLNLTRQRYDICRRLLNESKCHIYAKNGNVGSNKSLIEDTENCCYIVFNDSGDINEQKFDMHKSNIDINIHEKIENDLSIGSGYAAANQFIKLEEKFNKSVEMLTNSLLEEIAFIDLNKIYYPNINNYAETISKLVRKYTKIKDTSDNKELDIIKNELFVAYKNCYLELQKAKDSLQALNQNLKEVK